MKISTPAYAHSGRKSFRIGRSPCRYIQLPFLAMGEESPRLKKSASRSSETSSETTHRVNSITACSYPGRSSALILRAYRVSQLVMRMSISLVGRSLSLRSSYQTSRSPFVRPPPACLPSQRFGGFAMAAVRTGACSKVKVDRLALLEPVMLPRK